MSRHVDGVGIPTHDLRRPLLCRCPLSPDESLPSYLIRLAVTNGYEPCSLVETVGKQRLAALGLRGNVTHPEQAEAYESLSGLTEVCPRALAEATVHRFAQAPLLNHHRQTVIVLSDGQPFRLLAPWLRLKKVRKPDWAQFCPVCLREAAYHRLLWSLRDVRACVRHACWLSQTCLHCGAGVSLEAVVKDRCPACTVRLSAAQTPALPAQAFEHFMQATLQDWWGFAGPAGPASWTLPPEPIPVVYRLWERLTDLLTGKLHVEHALGFADQMPDQQEIRVCVFRALVDWPQGFYEFLCMYLPNKALQGFYYHPNVSYLDALQMSWQEGEWASEEFAFVQTAFEQFIGTSLHAF